MKNPLPWQDIETVFLDMDGTLLDLHFDNHFWLEHVPLRYAEKHAMTIDDAKQVLYPRFRALEGSIDWYCVDYWSRELGLDIHGLKRELEHLIQVHPHVAEFLLALRGTGRLPVAVFGDGDYLMGVSALWTAASTRTPLLIVIANNTGYYIDEQHQAMTSATRGRAVETAHVGQRIAEPEIDLLAMARAQGFEGCGPIARRAALRDAVVAGVRAVEEGECFLIDVRIRPDYEGYPR